MTVEISFEKLFQFKSLSDLLKSFPNEQECIRHLERRRWKGIITSPFNNNSRVYKCANNRYMCKNTGKYFNVKTGTVFENSKIALWKWFYIVYVFVNHKKSIFSCQISEDIGITQKSAWFALHRLRKASDLALLREMLKDFVEIDETFVGGKNYNRHKFKRND